MNCCRKKEPQGVQGRVLTPNETVRDRCSAGAELEVESRLRKIMIAAMKLPEKLNRSFRAPRFVELEQFANELLVSRPRAASRRRTEPGFSRITLMSSGRSLWKLNTNGKVEAGGRRAQKRNSRFGIRRGC